MAQRRMYLIMVSVAMLWAGVTAQSSCTNVLISLSTCLDYITGNSLTPSSGCCLQLAAVVRSQPECLCRVLSGEGSSLGININQTQALALPGACNVQTPPSSRCNAASPSDAPSGSPETQNADGPSGSKTVPSTGDGSSSGNSIKLSIPLFFLISALVFAATFTN